MAKTVKRLAEVSGARIILLLQKDSDQSERMVVMVINRPKSISIQTELKIKNTFIAADTDGDGWLSKDDLKSAFRELGAHVPEWRVFRSLKRIDANKSGVLISTAGPEFDEIVKYAFAKYGDKIGKNFN